MQNHLSSSNSLINAIDVFTEIEVIKIEFLIRFCLIRLLFAYKNNIIFQNTHLPVGDVAK